MKTLILMTVLALTLTGCATAWTPVRYAADQVCDASPAQQEVLAEAFDKGTHPHQIRVDCYGQVEE